MYISKIIYIIIFISIIITHYTMSIIINNITVVSSMILIRNI
jgi:hypothetical protein